MSYFDANTWIGKWPFSFQPEHTAASLCKALEPHGIRRALVSSLDTVFAPEPGPGNRHVLACTSDFPGLLPVPVINPALANWREELAHGLADARVKAIRLLPAYHGYRLRLPALRALVAAVEKARIRLIISVRLIDERHEYHAMTIKPVTNQDLMSFLKAYPRLPVLISGLLRSDVTALIPAFPHVLADLSFAEWHETLRHLLARTSSRQLAFASHTPFLITAAAPAKFKGSGLSPTKQAAMASKNLERFLRI